MESAVEIRLLGPVRVIRRGAEVDLPRSRKVRSLLALLALERSALSRSRLCDLLWDVPNDPKGELRWCLSKLRGVLDDDDRKRVVTTGQSLITLDLEDTLVDAHELARLSKEGLENVPTPRIEDVLALVSGELLEGMQVDGPALTGWLFAQRERHRSLHVALHHELARRAEPGSEEMFRRLELWLQRAPFDARAHEGMIESLVRAGRLRDAEAHVTRTIRAFEQEGNDWSSLRSTLERARTSSIPAASTSATMPIAAPPAPAPSRHGSVVVMPFTDSASTASELAHGLTDDIITRLAKLRVLFVIARGTSYALRDRGIAPSEAGRILNVDYVVSGSVRRSGERATILVELAETKGSGIVWTDTIEGKLDDTFSVLDTIVDRIVAAVSDEIERAESKLAVLKPPSSLDAWEAYHRGLWHMYRFTGPDNEIAAGFFREALKLDPVFARAHAGLSFTHFQNVFLDLSQNHENEMALALETARQSIAADDRDPAAHWAMGRALWLRREEGAVGELERSVALSPSFALGHYTLGFVQAQSGDPTSAIASADYSRELSPFDPLQFGMLGSLALAHMRRGERAEAAEFAVKAAARPNAHVHILTIAATNLALANRRDHAREVVSRIRTKLPSYTVEDFLRAFRFEPEAEKMIRQGAKLIGI